MSAPRRGARLDYRHFPPEYADLVRQFRDKGRAEIGPLTQGSARSTVRDLYRFRQFLSEALDADPGDDYARGLFDVFNSAVLHVEPVAVLQSPDDTCTHLVRFSLNPVVAAMRQVAKE